MTRCLNSNSDPQIPILTSRGKSRGVRDAATVVCTLLRAERQTNTALGKLCL
jgi:hypothetical protein